MIFFKRFILLTTICKNKKYSKFGIPFKNYFIKSQFFLGANLTTGDSSQNYKSIF